MKQVFTIIILLKTALILNAQNTDDVYFTTGLKIGELTSTSAVILTRLCKTENPTAPYHKRKETAFRPPIDFDNEKPVEKMEGAVLGAMGQIKIALKTKDTLITTEWKYVSSYKDFTLKTTFKKLRANTSYDVTVYGRKDLDYPITEIKGHFKTAPSEDDIIPVSFTASTCQHYWSFDDENRGFKIYDSMKKLNPDFHCQTGDFVYYDKAGPYATTIELARHKWHAMNSWPSLREFYNETPLYIQKDDHDLLKDDAGPHATPYGDLSYEDGVALWYEQVPITGSPYKTFRWGKDLQIWIVECREYRSNNMDPDSANKTIWGKKQIKWFKETVAASNATFKILVSPIPIVGPDRAEGKFDNHSNNSFKTEGSWLREYLASNAMFVINGDRHWQYVSVDPNTGLWEFSQGPVSDNHAQGWNENDVKPEHRFLRVKGGFLGVKVYRKKDKPIIAFLHYDVDGNIVNQETIKRKK